MAETGKARGPGGEPPVAPRRREAPRAVRRRMPEAADAGEPEPADEDTPEPADEPSADGAAGGRRQAAGPDERPARRGGSAMTARQAAEAAWRQIAEFTSKPVQGITEVQRADDGWLVGVEVVEDRRIPSSADILASYRTALDADGELVSYRRVRRYARGRGDDGEGS
jgi:hypothetical protein